LQLLGDTMNHRLHAALYQGLAETFARLAAEPTP
jgi:hypothetical protein